MTTLDTLREEAIQAALVSQARARVESKMQDLARAMLMARLACIELVETCVHPSDQLIEGNRGLAQPPFILCRTCGYAEEVWGARPWKLRHIPDRMEREPAWERVRVFVRQDQMEALGRYGAARANPQFTLLDCVRSV